jgi:UDP-N-acetyl-D-mannosaminuronic acid transferase (WecB/TagA/CpsF family)
MNSPCATSNRLKAGWLVTCGGCFNFVTGAYKRAPQWMQARWAWNGCSAWFASPKGYSGVTL